MFPLNISNKCKLLNTDEKPFIVTNSDVKWSLEIDRKCLHGLTIDKYLSQGRTSVVYSTTDNRVIKFIPLGIFNDEKSIIKEIENTKKVIKLALFEGPLETRRCKSKVTIGNEIINTDTILMVLPRWDLDFDTYKQKGKIDQKNKEIIFKLFNELAAKYIKYGLYLRDLHEKNIVLKLDLEGNVKDLTFIDFNDLVDEESDFIKGEMDNVIDYLLGK